MCSAHMGRVTRIGRVGANHSPTFLSRSLAPRQDTPPPNLPGGRATASPGHLRSLLKMPQAWPCSHALADICPRRGGCPIRAACPVGLGNAEKMGKILRSNVMMIMARGPVLATTAGRIYDRLGPWPARVILSAQEARKEEEDEGKKKKRKNHPSHVGYFCPWVPC